MLLLLKCARRAHTRFWTLGPLKILRKVLVSHENQMNIGFIANRCRQRIRYANAKMVVLRIELQTDQITYQARKVRGWPIFRRGRLPPEISHGLSSEGQAWAPAEGAT